MRTIPKMIFTILLVLIFILAVYFSICVFLVHSGVIVYSSTVSINKGFFIRLPFLETREGDTARFLSPLNFGDIEVDGRMITKEDIPFDYFIKRVGKIEKGMCFMEGRGDSEIERIEGKGAKSFDSRYFGLIPYGSLERVVYLPLFTLGYTLYENITKTRDENKVLTVDY